MQPVAEVMKKMATEAHEFRRLVLSKEEALDMFADNPFKVQLIMKKVRGSDPQHSWLAPLFRLS